MARRVATENETGDPAATVAGEAGLWPRSGASGAMRAWPKNDSANFCLHTGQNETPSARMSQLALGRNTQES